MVRKIPTPPRAPRLRTLPKKHRPKPKSAQAKAPRENIIAHEYSPETGHLTITFHGGRRYRYEGVGKEGVGKEGAEAFAGAESKGRFLRSSIIGKFDASKLSD